MPVTRGESDEIFLEIDGSTLNTLRINEPVSRNIMRYYKSVNGRRCVCGRDIKAGLVSEFVMEGGRAIDKTFSSFPRWSGGLATGLLFSRDTSDRARPISMFRNFRRNFRRRCLIRRSSDFLPPFPSIILGIINA